MMFTNGYEMKRELIKKRKIDFRLDTAIHREQSAQMARCKQDLKDQRRNKKQEILNNIRLVDNPLEFLHAPGRKVSKAFLVEQAKARGVRYQEKTRDDLQECLLNLARDQHHSQSEELIE